jgi:hypothetical protein
MNKNRLLKTITFLFLLLSATNSYSWWSAETIINSTHYKETKDSEDLLSQINVDQYPDVTTKYGDNIRDWTSGINDDKAAHDNDSTRNDGPIQQWFDNAIEKYKSLNFNNDNESTYYYIALMIHLIEDQGVPAHAYKIYHGNPGNMDNLEQQGYYNYKPNTVYGLEYVNDPVRQMEFMKNCTLDATADSYWRQYWLGNVINLEPYTGVYAGLNGTDKFPTGWSEGSPESNLVSELEGKSYSYAAGALMAISRKLPPLIQSLTIGGSQDNPLVNKTLGTTITLKALENRRPDVTIFITVDSLDGMPIAADNFTNGGTFTLKPGTELPWEDTLNIKWNGKLADGAYLSDGEHTLYVQVQDEDKNLSEAATQKFTMDNKAPSFSVSISPAFATLGNGQVQTHTVTVHNKNVPANVLFHMNASETGWYSDTLLRLRDNRFSIAPGKDQKFTFNVTAAENNWDSFRGVIAVQLEGSNTKPAYASVYDWLSPDKADADNGINHKPDHPDDNASISAPNYPTPWLVDTKSNIGLLLAGNCEGLGHLLGAHNIQTAPVATDLTIINEPDRPLSDLKVLLIGSACLDGMKSQVFKDKLASYVSNGGTIVCLTQKFGTDFGVLPAPSPNPHSNPSGSDAGLSGYGWSEDQSCFGSAVYINNASPVFAGQNKSVLDVSVDGYFTKWPDNTNILLKRAMNQMPALIQYKYGSGTVIAGTMFSDWGYGNKKSRFKV